MSHANGANEPEARERDAEGRDNGGGSGGAEVRGDAEGRDGVKRRAEAECGEEVAGRAVRVDSLKFDGRLHRSWPARLVRREGSLLVLEGVFETEVRHALLGRILAGTLSTEFYWTDRWYSVFRFREPSGELRNYYCNVNRPAEFDGKILSFVDLDIDVLVAPDFTYAVLDEDEFETHAAEFGYDDALRARVRRSLAELLRLIEARAFPFDGTDRAERRANG